jgi:hypothetical protein
MVADIGIYDEGEQWRLYIPIVTGSLELTVEKGRLDDLDRFLSTALKTPLRRFGDNPSQSTGN